MEIAEPSWREAGVGKGDARLLARPILQEYDAFTVDVIATHPAEFGKLAARHNLVEIAEACRRGSEIFTGDCRKEADVGTMDRIGNCYGRHPNCDRSDLRDLFNGNQFIFHRIRF